MKAKKVIIVRKGKVVGTAANAGKADKAAKEAERRDRNKK